MTKNAIPYFMCYRYTKRKYLFQVVTFKLFYRDGGKNFIFVIGWQVSVMICKMKAYKWKLWYFFALIV